MTEAHKVVLIGLESAEHSLIREWAAAGLLPNFQALYETAAWGLITNPPGIGSASVWPTFCAATSPGKHGRYHNNRYFNSQSYREEFYAPGQARYEPFWARIGDAGKRLAIIDVPYLRLIEGLNGLHIINWGPHDRTGDFQLQTWPHALRDEIVGRFGEDPFGSSYVSPCDEHPPVTTEDYAAFRSKLMDRLERKTDMVAHLLEREDWDFFLAAFGEPHCVGHHCWHFCDASHPAHDPEALQQVGNPLKDVYAGLDRAIGRLLPLVAQDHTVIVYSSHGMGAGYGGANLLDQILMRLEGEPPATMRRGAIGLLRSAWRRAPDGLRSLLMPLRTTAWESYFQAQRKLPQRRFFEEYLNEATGGVRINLKGREANGIVEPGAQYQELCDRLAEDLSEIQNLESRQPLVQRITKSSEIYHGERAGAMPDLLVEWNRAAPIRRVHSPKVGTLEHGHSTMRSGDHRPLGLFFAKGPRVTPGALDEPVCVMDFGPTVADLVGVALAESDGRAIAAICGAEAAGGARRSAPW